MVLTAWLDAKLVLKPYQQEKTAELNIMVILGVFAVPVSVVDVISSILTPRSFYSSSFKVHVSKRKTVEIQKVK